MEIFEASRETTLCLQMESFHTNCLVSWNLGTCVPQSILGPSGYLPLRQTQIESLRLVADGSCSWSADRQCRLALSAFQHLTRLSWAGLCRDDDLETLADVLERISNQLVEFELDLIRCCTLAAEMDEEDDSIFARDILRLPQREQRIFPSLRLLSLSGVFFAPCLAQIVDQFDFSIIRSLTLRDCPGYQELLDHLIRSSQPIRLKFLEIQ